MDTCSICLSDINEQNDEISQLDCSHKYHKECLDNWLKISDKCPFCRTTTTINNENVSLVPLRNDIFVHAHQVEDWWNSRQIY